MACTVQKDLEVQGKKLVSQKPPFTLTLPSGFNLAHSFSHESPEESSVTRGYFLVKTKGKQIEEMIILQIADKTNPQAGPMSAPPLKPYLERRSYLKGKIRELDYLIQLMAWNPDAPSLQPIVKQGIIIPSRLALQGQIQFLYQGEHAVSIRYSRDANSFGTRVSEKGDDWDKALISGNQKRVYETFYKNFMGMIDSIRMKTP